MNQSPLSPNTQTHFAWLRTRMALQTTLAAWVRTATSLIGFGFAIVQFVENFHRIENGSTPRGPHLARIVGLVLIAGGSLTTAIATWEYRKVVRYLESEGFQEVAGISTLRRPTPDVAFSMAVLVCLIGVLAFVFVLTVPELR